MNGSESNEEGKRVGNRGGGVSGRWTERRKMGARFKGAGGKMMVLNERAE